MGKKLFTIFIRGLQILILCFLAIVLISGSTLLLNNIPEKVRQYTHTIEFDYAEWTLKAFWNKIEQSSVHLEDYLPEQKTADYVREYVKTVSLISELKSRISILYSNPDIGNRDAAVAPYRQKLDATVQNLNRLAPLAESTLQMQTSLILARNGLTTLGQPLPPVLFHSTPLPLALIVSPRDKIQQDANISLLTDMSAGDMNSLEDQVMKNLNVSALVVPVGGVGVYPTMVMQTSDLPYLTETIAHEWIHNYLTLRPLGINYETTPELRTINETVASIAGSEIGEQVLREYYPEYLPKDDFPATSANSKTARLAIPRTDGPAFDFRVEMHTTRVTVDGLLSNGEIKEAEQYMEERRTFFWNNGYAIRRLNQAYFAFYGAYADTPGGAAGKDPVGPVVRAFREQCGSLPVFLDQVSRVTSFDQLKGMVKSLPID
jgi:hypothetical protein